MNFRIRNVIFGSNKRIRHIAAWCKHHSEVGRVNWKEIQG